MRAAISTRRIVSIFCLLLTLVISLFISNYYFADDSVLEGLTVEGLSPSVAQKMDTTEDSKKGSLDSKKADDNTDIMEDFQLQYEDVSNETHIRTTPDKQPPMPSRNNTLGVFNHVFGMSNPNEQFVIPRI